MSASHKQEKGIQKFLTDIPKIILIIVTVGVITNFLPDSTLNKMLILIQNENKNTGTVLNDENLSREKSKSILKGVYKVNKVIDGDTISVIKLRDNSNLNQEDRQEIIKVRLLGINTPETVDPRREVECFGLEASNNMKLLANDTNVILETDVSQDTYDKYGRLLAYVFLESGEMLNEIQIKNGYAYEYTYDKPYKYQSSFKLLQSYAKDNKLGLWNPLSCDQK
jgi:micrococcal nuclease